ncbi:MAG: hypothetical protein K6C68_13180 [Ruminococcus sp.]|nr:hypothetical protein [Ruminococcus sp.]
MSYNMLSSSTEKPKGTESGYTVENYTDEIKRLDDMTWYYLSTEEKLDLLQIIANIESNTLGLSNELNVGASNLEKDSLDYGTFGTYNDLTHSIIIDIQYLEQSDSMSCVELLCHEAYHSYEHDLVRVYQNLNEEDRQLSIFNDAPVYEYEFDHPIIPDKDYEGYLDQLTESNARKYARDEMIRYYVLVTDFKGECEPSDDDIDIGIDIPSADGERVVKV